MPGNNHKPECNEYTCYCIDEQGDPMCECGEPSYACKCDQETYQIESFARVARLVTFTHKGKLAQ